MASSVKVSPAQDPHGGLWVFTYARALIYRLSFETGDVMQSFPIDTMLGAAGTEIPSSPMTIALSPSGTPVMLVGAGAVGGLGASYVAAIDLQPASPTLLWKLKFGTAPGGGNYSLTWSQFPIVVNDHGLPRIVFPTSNTGANFVGQPY